MGRVRGEHAGKGGKQAIGRIVAQEHPVFPRRHRLTSKLGGRLRHRFPGAARQIQGFPPGPEGAPVVDFRPVLQNGVHQDAGKGVLPLGV